MCQENQPQRVVTFTGLVISPHFWGLYTWYHSHLKCVCICLFYVLLILFTHYCMAHEVIFGTTFMLSLDYSISFSEDVSDNVLANAITSIFWPRCMVCLKDIALPWSKRATMFQQGLQSSLSSSHKTEAGRYFPGLWFTWKPVSVAWPKFQDLHRSTHDSQELESYVQLRNDCLHGEIGKCRVEWASSLA